MYRDVDDVCSREILKWTGVDYIELSYEVKIIEEWMTIVKRSYKVIFECQCQSKWNSKFEFEFEIWC